MILSFIFLFVFALLFLSASLFRRFCFWFRRFRFFLLLFIVSSSCDAVAGYFSALFFFFIIIILSPHLTQTERFLSWNSISSVVEYMYTQRRNYFFFFIKNLEWYCLLFCRSVYLFFFAYMLCARVHIQSRCNNVHQHFGFVAAHVFYNFILLILYTMYWSFAIA